jgi:hypothetical protein
MIRLDYNGENVYIIYYLGITYTSSGVLVCSAGCRGIYYIPIQNSKYSWLLNLYRKKIIQKHDDKKLKSKY